MKEDSRSIKSIERKREQLTKIVSSVVPIDPNLKLNHDRKVLNAGIFLEELDEVQLIVEHKENVYVVPMSTMNRQIEKSDFVSVEFEGYYTYVVNIKNFPYDDLYLVYAARIDQI